MEACIFSQHDLLVVVIITGHLHWSVLTQKTRLVRNVTRVKRTSSITSSFIGERKIILNEMIHGNVLVKIHGEIKKNDKNGSHLQNVRCFKIAL
jgi:hypothetical protein